MRQTRSWVRVGEMSVSSGDLGTEIGTSWSVGWIQVLEEEPELDVGSGASWGEQSRE